MLLSYEKKTYMPSEFRAKACPRLLSQEYFGILSHSYLEIMRTMEERPQSCSPREEGGRKESLVKRTECPKSICSILVGSWEKDSPPVYPT